MNTKKATKLPLQSLYGTFGKPLKFKTILIIILRRVFILTENFLEIFCSSISILTLTLYRPNLDFKFLSWYTLFLLNL